MRTDELTDRISAHLGVLASDIGPRPAGSPGNREATDYLCRVLAGAGLDVEQRPFTCRDWEPGAGSVELPDGIVAVAPDRFSDPCAVRGPVKRAGRLDDLRDDPPAGGGEVVVLEGGLTSEPLFPRNFPYIKFTHHQELINLLEARGPAAVVVVSPTERPAPIFDDGDLPFPSTTVPASVGPRLLEGLHVGVKLGGSVSDGHGVNVSARGGGAGTRIVLSAHVDCKATTPGAFNNAGGVATLLALAEHGLPDAGPIELVFFNGQDHYAVPGQQVWFADADLSEIRMTVNVDGAGLAGRASTVTTLSCPPRLEQRLGELAEARDGWETVQPWRESDHAIFAMYGVPSVAIASAGLREALDTLAHTPEDTFERLDVATLAGVAGFVTDWLTTVAEERLLSTPL